MLRSKFARTTARSLLTAAALVSSVGAKRAPPVAFHDILITNAMIYDGSGGVPYSGVVLIDGQRISYVGPVRAFHARRVIDAGHKAVAPGFINMLSQGQDTLLVDGRGASDLLQGVTLEILGEGESFAPLSGAMAQDLQQEQGDLKYAVTWRSFKDYLDRVQSARPALNVAAVVGAATIRENILGNSDIDPSSAQLEAMRALTRTAMEDGAIAIGSALIYPPGSYAKTDELKALAGEAGACGGIYLTHMRSEGGGLLAAIDETIAIARASGAPAEIYHLKAAGKPNWPLMDAAIAKILGARRQGVRLSADIYPYTAAATGFDASMPRWVMTGGLEAWIARLHDPASRARLLSELKSPPPGFESALVGAGAEGTLLLSFKNPKLKPLTGKTLAEVARERGKSPEETMIDLIAEDGSRVGVAYFLMSEDNVRKAVAQPWISFGSDGEAIEPEGAFLLAAAHPRTYGTFAKILGQYVHKERLITLASAVRRLSALPADNLGIVGRGRLRAGNFADIVIFDPAAIKDRATYQEPHHLATGMETVLVNGQLAVEGGQVTAARGGQVVRGRAWTGNASGGCRRSASDWQWKW